MILSEREEAQHLNMLDVYLVNIRPAHNLSTLTKLFLRTFTL
jgi:hypothetical protein